MIRKAHLNLKHFFNQLKTIDLLDFNKFIFHHLLLHSFKTENILPFFIAVGVIGFSIAIQASRFIFIPQTSAAAFVSFLIFASVVSIIILIIYPIIIIILVNFLTSYFKGSASNRSLIKITILLLGFVGGVVLFTGRNISTPEKLQILLIWIGLYFVLVGLYLTHREHSDLRKITKTKIAFILVVLIIMTRPLMLVFLHTTEALNYTNINTQLYLSPQNCHLLHNLNGSHTIPAQNSIFDNKQYFEELPDNQGCYLYSNTIRYSFAYDFVLLVKKNIHPLVSPRGIKYNEYVRLSCYAGNCYSENNIFFHTNDDLNAELIQKGAKADYPL